MLKYTVCKLDGQWVVLSEKNLEVLFSSNRKRAATLEGRNLLRAAGGGELMIVSVSGRIREVQRI